MSRGGATARAWWWRALGALMLLAMGVWANTLHGGVVDYDTPWLVVDNPLLSGGDVTRIPTLLFSFDAGDRVALGAEYLPVRDLSVLLDFAVFGDAFLGHHAVNLVLYLLSCGLLLAIFVRLFGARVRAWGAAALFAVHPVHVESVSWLASRKDVLSLALGLAAILLWMTRKDGPWRYWASVALTLLAYWAKNTAVVLPAMMVLLSLLHEGERPNRASWWVGFVPYGLVIGLGLGITLQLGAEVSMYAAPRGAGPWEVFTVQAQVLTQYLGMLLWPAWLSPLYAEPVPVGASSLGLWIGALTLLGSGGLALACARSRPLVTLGIGWFFVGLAPVSQLVPIQNLIADRYLLIPSAGVALALAALLPDRVDRRVGTGLGAALLVCLLALGAVTWRVAGDWQDSTRLWARAVEFEPAEPKGWSNLAGSLMAEGRGPEALALLDRGLQTLPNDAGLLQSRGWVRMRGGDLVGAEADLRAALAADPHRRRAANNLAVLLKRADRHDEAIAVLDAILVVHPRYAEGWNTLGAVLLEQRALDRADAALRRALELAPYDHRTTYNLGTVAYLAQDRQGAVGWWQRTLALDPGNAAAQKGLDHLARTQ